MSDKIRLPSIATITSPLAKRQSDHGPASRLSSSSVDQPVAARAHDRVADHTHDRVSEHPPELVPDHPPEFVPSRHPLPQSLQPPPSGPYPVAHAVPPPFHHNYPLQYPPQYPPQAYAVGVPPGPQPAIPVVPLLDHHFRDPLVFLDALRQLSAQYGSVQVVLSPGPQPQPVPPMAYAMAGEPRRNDLIHPALVESLFRKRKRRKKHEVTNRIYDCNFQGCTKSYSCLSHLNTHITQVKHGKRRSGEEFKHRLTNPTQIKQEEL